VADKCARSSASLIATKVGARPLRSRSPCILTVLASERSFTSIVREVHVRKSLKVRPFAEHAARPASMNTMFFNALQMASCLHMRVTGCALIKEATMLEEIKAAQIPDCGRTEVESTSVKTSSSFVELRNSLPSHVDIVFPFVDQLMHFISRFRVADESNVEIELALREALVNAIVHGNHEDLQKRVQVKCRCTAHGEVSITVEDEGQGFSHAAVPDPTSPDNRLRTHGRGIYLMRVSMDEVHFDKGGSVVRMRKNPTADLSAQRRTQ